MKPDKEIVDVPDFFVTGERYSLKSLLAGIPLGIRVPHLNNFATLLDLMGVPTSLRVRPYDKSIFSLTAQDNRARYYMSGSLHGFGDYVVKMIPTPPDAGWGFRDLPAMVPSRGTAEGTQARGVLALVPCNCAPEAFDWIECGYVPWHPLAAEPPVLLGDWTHSRHGREPVITRRALTPSPTAPSASPSPPRRRKLSPGEGEDLRVACDAITRWSFGYLCSSHLLCR
jgi:hypothetical protein